MTTTSQFAGMKSSSHFFDIVLFLLSRLVSGLSFMSVSSLVLELWQFTFIRDWSEIQKSEIPPSEFYPISVDSGKLGIPNLVQMSLMKFYYMLQNAKVTALIVFKLNGKPTAGGRGELPARPPPTQIRVKTNIWSFYQNILQKMGRRNFSQMILHL